MQHTYLNIVRSDHNLGKFIYSINIFDMSHDAFISFFVVTFQKTAFCKDSIWMFEAVGNLTTVWFTKIDKNINSWWWWWWWIVFVVWLTDEMRLALFPARTIVRDSHHRESPTRRAGFKLAQNLSSGLVEWSCAVVITTTPRRLYQTIDRKLLKY